MLTPANRFLVVLNLSIVALGCSDGPDLVKTDAHPAFVPPDIHGTPARGYIRIESDRPLSVEEMLGHARRQSVEPVEVVSSAIIQTGMRQAPPDQQDGEVLLRRWVTGDPNEPWYPYGNFPNNYLILQHNGNWPNLHSPVATWPSGYQMGDYIKQASFWAPPGKCVGFRPYQHENYVGAYNFLGNLVCKTPAQSGESWLLWDQNWQISSIKTAFTTCVVGNCPAPPGF